MEEHDDPTSKPSTPPDPDALFELDDLDVGDDALAGVSLTPAAPVDEDRPPMAAHFGKLA